MYGASSLPDLPPAGPPGASRPSVPPPPDDAAQHPTLLGSLPVRPSVPPSGMDGGGWGDDPHDELTFPSPSMPAWAHGSTTPLEADEAVVKAIAGWSEPPPPPGPADGFVSFCDSDELQFDPQRPSSPAPPPARPDSARRASSSALTPVPSGDSWQPEEADPGERGSSPALEWSAGPEPVSAPGWSEPSPSEPNLSLPSLPPLDDTPPLPPPPPLPFASPPGLVPSSRPPRTRKPTPAMPMATLAALLGESGRVEEPPTKLSPVQPPGPYGESPRSAAPEPTGWSSWEAPASGAPALDERAEARLAMRDRLSLEDFAGALAVAERILQLDRDDREARQIALRCREELRSLYSRRLGPLDQVPSTIVTPSEIRWLSLDHRAGFVLSLIDGSSTIEDIIDVSTMPSLEVLRTLHNLLTQKVIVLRRARPRR